MSSAATAVFRVDASMQIGSGHVMRCLTLAEMLGQAGVESHFICREHTGHLCSHIRSRGFDVTLLPLSNPASERPLETDPPFPSHQSWLGTDWETDASATAGIVSKLKPQWLVVDHYALDYRWEAALRPECGKLMVIDDLADRRHQCDLLLDQNLGRESSDYARLVPAHCKVLTGPRYALLRPEFRAVRSYSLRRREAPSVNHLLVTMGGVDQTNATGKVLNELKSCNLDPGCQITVVMGSQAPWLKQVEQEARSMPWPTNVLANVGDMANRMAESDLAIGAAGSTSWERCALGLPSVMLVLADNQRGIAEALHRAGAACLLDSTEDPGAIADRVQILLGDRRALAEMSARAVALVDGLGTERVTSSLGWGLQ